MWDKSYLAGVCVWNWDDRFFFAERNQDPNSGYGIKNKPVYDIISRRFSS
jgi:hypothetical protein